MRAMGLDVGTVRLGVALSCPLGSFAQPHAVLWARQASVGPTLAAWVAEYEVGVVVVGRPLTLAGETGPAAQATHRYILGIEGHLQVPWVWWDERLSTRAAERALVGMDMRRQRRRQVVDKVAAAWMLQGYLDRQLQGGSLAERRGDPS